MTILRDAILNCMIETGRLAPGDKIEITAITGDNWSDYRRVEILATKKRCKKPFIYWNLCIDTVRELIHWDTSTSYYL